MPDLSALVVIGPRPLRARRWETTINPALRFRVRGAASDRQPHLVLAVLLAAGAAACNSDNAGPTSAASPAADSSVAVAGDTAAPPLDTAFTAPDTVTAMPADSGGILEASVVLDGRSTRPGIVFGTFKMSTSLFNTVHTGAVRGGIDAGDILPLLAGAKSRGARVVVKLCNGPTAS